MAQGLPPRRFGVAARLRVPHDASAEHVQDDEAAVEHHADRGEQAGEDDLQPEAHHEPHAAAEGLRMPSFGDDQDEAEDFGQEQDGGRHRQQRYRPVGPPYGPFREQTLPVREIVGLAQVGGGRRTRAVE
jgi:hypothetical protein